MKSLGADPSLLPVQLAEDDVVTVESEPIGHLEGFRFVVDHLASHADRKMLLAAGEKALPRLLAERARVLVESGLPGFAIADGSIEWDGRPLARLDFAQGAMRPQIVLARELAQLPDADRRSFEAAMQQWLDAQLAPLAPLAKLEAAARDPAAGSQARALLLNLIDEHGHIARDKTGIEHLPKEMRPYLRRLGVTFGALDVFVPALLKPAPRRLLAALGLDRRPLDEQMRAVLPSARRLPSGYRLAGNHAVRIDVAEKLLRAAHEARAKSGRGGFMLDPALALSTGLTEASWRRLLGAAGFRFQPARTLKEGAFGPPARGIWHWRPARRAEPQAAPVRPREGGAFAALADLVR